MYFLVPSRLGLHVVVFTHLLDYYLQDTKML
uniref:Uncharacterized protein n=1 Tax=Rhizophora mucronata TaxID=61149 RepID=A0A2P2PDU7_RHIMU